MKCKSLEKRHACSDLQEVLGSATSGCGNGTLIVGNGREDSELRIDVLIHIHDGRDVTAAIAVIRCRPNRNDILSLEVILESFIDELMGASNKTQTVDVIELSNMISSNSIRSP